MQEGLAQHGSDQQSRSLNQICLLLPGSYTHWWSHPGPTTLSSALQAQERAWFYCPISQKLVNKSTILKHKTLELPLAGDPGVDIPSLFNKSTWKS